MEKYPTIDQYIAAEMNGKIVKRAKSPLVGIVILAMGIGLLVLMHSSHMADSLQALLLTLGVLALGVGLVLTAMCLTKALWHWQYLPSHSCMRLKKHYLSATDYQRALEALGNNNISALAALHPIVSANSELQVLCSQDHSFALLQLGHMDTGHFEPATPVIRIIGTEIAAIQVLCR